MRRVLLALLVAAPFTATVAPAASASAPGPSTRFRSGHVHGRQHGTVRIGTALRITRNADGSVTYSEQG